MPPVEPPPRVAELRPVFALRTAAARFVELRFLAVVRRDAYLDRTSLFGDCSNERDGLISLDLKLRAGHGHDRMGRIAPRLVTRVIRGAKVT